MRVSVVVCEHTLDRYDDLRDAAESVLEQTYDDVELVLVSDGNQDVCNRFEEEYGDRDDVRVHCNDENAGLLESRNNGAMVATGDVVAFLDDDAIADRQWIAELVETYEIQDVPAVGGKMAPAWMGSRPWFLPEEFYWLVGVTHRGFADGPGEVRNTFGSNISFRREIFLNLGGFETNIGGRQGDANLQGGETELCARLNTEYGYGVYYNPRAVVEHKVFSYRINIGWLLDRAFWQGYSKRGMEVLVSESTYAEADFFRRLLAEYVPHRIQNIVATPSIEEIVQLMMLFVFTGAVVLGYVYGFIKWR